MNLLIISPLSNVSLVSQVSTQVTLIGVNSTISTEDDYNFNYNLNATVEFNQTDYYYNTNIDENPMYESFLNTTAKLVLNDTTVANDD